MADVARRRLRAFAPGRAHVCETADRTGSATATATATIRRAVCHAHAPGNSPVLAANSGASLSFSACMRWPSCGSSYAHCGPPLPFTHACMCVVDVGVSPSKIGVCQSAIWCPSGSATRWCKSSVSSGTERPDLCTHNQSNPTWPGASSACTSRASAPSTQAPRLPNLSLPPP